MIPALKSLAYLPARLSRNPIVLNIEAPGSAAFPSRSGLRYYCKVMVPESYLSAGYKTLVELEAAEQPPIPVGGGFLYQGAFFEIQNQLDSLLDRSAPEFDQARISVADRLTSPFYCVLSIRNNDTDVSSKTLPVETIVKAGIAEVDYSAYKELFFSDFIGGRGRFLTWAADHKQIHPDQPEFLYFLTNFSPAPATLRLCCEVTYANSETEVFCGFELANILPMTAYCAPVGPKALGLDRKLGTVLSYRVWLADEADHRISEVRSYVMIQEYFRNVRFIVFANSLGGFDTLALVGQGEESLKISRTITERYNGWQFLPSYAERVIQEAEGSRELSVATGWLDKAQLRYLEELAFSKEVYLATDRAFVPLVPGFDQLRSVVDDEDLPGRLLAFQYTNPQTNYSELPDPENLPKRATGWRPKASACLLDANGRRTGRKQATVLEQYYLDDGKTVVGVPLKGNLPGTVGYIPPITSPDCQVPAYLNTAISRAGSYLKRTCTSPYQGGPAAVTVAAGVYGSELSLADAQSKAEREWNRLNTQAYADLNGSCVLEPEKYTFAVPSNHWHYRAANPASLAIHWLIVNDPDGRGEIGNAWMIQGQNRTYVFGMNSNDLDFPISYGTGNGWRLIVNGPAGSLRHVRIYQNGSLKLDYQVAMNSDGFEYVALTSNGSNSFVLAAGDKLYLTNDPA